MDTATEPDSEESLLDNSDQLNKWIESYSSNSYGIWVQCCLCEKWRCVKEYEEQHEIPEVWVCSMNKDLRRNNCDASEDEGNFESADVEYVPGSVVWAKENSRTWWPGMVEYDVATNFYYSCENNKVTHYCVTLFKKQPIQVWVEVENVKSFEERITLENQPKRINRLLFEQARDVANKAFNLKLPERLKQYSFIYQDANVSKKKKKNKPPVSLSSKPTKTNVKKNNDVPRLSLAQKATLALEEDNNNENSDPDVANLGRGPNSSSSNETNYFTSLKYQIAQDITVTSKDGSNNLTFQVKRKLLKSSGAKPNKPILSANYHKVLEENSFIVGAINGILDNTEDIYFNLYLKDYKQHCS